MQVMPEAMNDPLHPTGRCSCGGGGECAWCLAHPEPEDPPEGCYCPPDECQAPVVMGRQVGCVRTEPDYRELGYPETEVTETDVEKMGEFARSFAYCVPLAARGLLRIREKEGDSKKG